MTCQDKLTIEREEQIHFDFKMTFAPCKKKSEQLQKTADLFVIDPKNGTA